MKAKIALCLLNVNSAIAVFLTISALSGDKMWMLFQACFTDPQSTRDLIFLISIATMFNTSRRSFLGQLLRSMNKLKMEGNYI